ncbi:MAG: hypothetical protein A3I24_03370 [Candidatus Harrisonbacteria bacterium RIFCSPLOWO2_02_FULL_41_13b]|uniref:O-acetylhomoserine aminocarboxypropyltransferase n=1 Tax=Candidatus Harrisonbacteria bacterium RIFCSPLOWO2_02_FULL_41_13b TaxID=1798409 RepID=A0A1G1ZSF6_9BACT|nr:MAG: hypothetical protein A3J53_02910 [Candidatus Harrisonbacteria bacterium RIFCSPHIGHO2_02_FULL_40_20]OGY66690.1 MAG: hypothetical protein A3I24_03370 [Candidatus Harrisonbacteria bacterium RIFCSPLOWO2_02_FULL_41_13b]
MQPVSLRPKTLEIHGGGSLQDRELRQSVQRVVAFPLGSPQRAQRLFDGKENGFVYTRINNPTVGRLEDKIAAMENAEAGLVTSSGMSAIKLVAEYLAHRNGKIISSNRLYGGTFHLFQEFLPQLGITVNFITNPDQDAYYDAFTYKCMGSIETKFIYVETPSNPLIDIFDIKRLSEITRNLRLPLVVDSTLATPALLNPIKLGADIVIHSLSKYMGDGEVIGGIILGKKALIDDMRNGWFRETGPCISPDNAAILSYHIESLFGRMAEHCRNAELVAQFLANHKKVIRVFYPTQGPRAKKNRKLMPNGFGGLMAIEVKGGQNEAWTVLKSLKLFWHAANIGEARSLVIHPTTTTHGKMSPADREKAGIIDAMLRLSIGREDPKDLIDDLNQALKKI